MSDEQLEQYPRLSGKIVLITGASAGIGEAAAIHFAACGSNLILLARRIDKLDSLAQDLREKYQVNVFTFKVDLAKPESFEEFVTALPDDFKEVDVIVNNAGLALSVTKLYEYDWNEINTMFDVNVKGSILVIQHFVPGMIARGRGHIINVGSIAGKEAYPNGSIYCATKHALEAVSDSLRHELIDTPLRVTKISPGAVDTEFSSVRYHGDTDKAANVYKNYVPLYGPDVADNIVYAASRPEHVQIVDITVFPSAQASVRFIHRNE
eukprot:TRINITY_DN3375_c1_g3_i1.p1 TRINITY_DN3375_c1_g3~~TRINITY_DN3375_c1_g3_i1.p1  ORF type:complete len:266 (+),score=58.98 TRINITY_DN3375_c1_g3_i1:118-915(+)